ncbi:MAG: twin-arginine translocase TatA/TatE family subunit [Chloroflexi bacterium]|nr:twin-arginine translocase TatA/TatE family subunit [Chloroflexota bacterium]
MPFRFGPLETGLILVIVLIVFGAGKLPQVGSSFGKAIREFRKETAKEHVGGAKPPEFGRRG